MPTRKIQRVKHTFAPDRGLVQNVSPTLLDGRQCPQCSNVKFRNTEVSKSPGYNLFASDGLPLSNSGAAGLRVMALPHHTSLAGSTSYFAVTTKDIFLYDSSNFRWRAMGKIAEDCEDAWTAAANVTDANDTGKVGTYSRKLTATSSYTKNATYAYEDVSLGDLSAYNRVHFWIKSTLAQDASDLAIRFAQDATLGGTVASANIPALAAATWYYLSLDITLTSINSCDSVGLVTSAGFDDTKTQTIWIDDVRCSTKFTGDQDDQFTWCSQAGAGATTQETTPEWYLILTNGADAPRKWSSGDEFTALTGDLNTDYLTTSKVAISYTDTLHLMNNTENSLPIPQRDRFGDTAEEDDWKTGVYGFVDCYDTPGEILAATLLGPYLVVYKTDGVVLLEYNAAATPVINKTSRVTGNQFFATKAIASANNVDYFLTRDNVHTFAGLHDAPAIGDPIRDELLDFIAWDNSDECFAFSQPGRHRIWFVVPHNDTNAATTTKFWVYDYLEKVWAKGEFADYINCAGVYEGGSITTWAQLSGAWTAQVGAWSDMPAEASDKAILLGDKNGYTYQLADTVHTYHDTAIDASFETKDFSLAPDHMERSMRYGKIAFVARGDLVSVSYSTDEGTTWTAIQADQVLTTERKEYSYPLNFSARKCRFKFHDDTDSKDFFISSVSPEYIFTTTRK